MPKNMQDFYKCDIFSLKYLRVWYTFTKKIYQEISNKGTRIRLDISRYIFAAKIRLLSNYTKYVKAVWRYHV